MTKLEICKELDKLGIEFNILKKKDVLQSQLTRAQNKLTKEKVIEVQEEVDKVIAKKPVEKVFYWGQHRKIVRKFEDLGNGEVKVFFDDSKEVVEKAIFEANIKEE